MRGEAAWAAAGALVTGAAALATAWGLPPAVALACAVTLWLPIAARRLGAALAFAVVVAVTGVGLLLTTIVSHLGPPAPVWTAVLSAAAAAGAPVLVRRRPVAGGAGGRVLLLAAAGMGPLFWVVCLAASQLSPSGAGLSWAMYRDSSMNVWGLRRLIAAGGLDSFSPGANVQPLQDAWSLAVTPWQAASSANSHDVGAAMLGYASAWSVVIALCCVGAGLVVAAGMHSGARRPRVVLACAVSASLGMLASPVSGVLVDLGQVNGHIVLLIVFASVLAARGSSPAPLLAIGALAALTALAIAVWLPFAFVPASLAAHVSWLWRRRVVLALSGRVSGASVPLLVGGVLAVTAAAVWVPPVVRAAVTARDEDPSGSILGIETFAREGFWQAYTNPSSWTVSLAVASALMVAVIAVRSRLAARTLGVTAVLLAAISAVMVLGSGAAVNDLPYYPAKALWLTTAASVPLAVGAALGAALDRRSVARHMAGTATILGVVATLAIAPLPDGQDRWENLALDVASGHHVGTSSQVEARVIALGGDATLVLPWRLDPPHDTTVGLMASAFAPSIPDVEFAATRYVLRFYRNDFSADVACELAAADARAVTLLTADPALSSEIAQSCPGADITVELVD